MADQMTKPADMWALERYLTQRRKEIDGKYELRSLRLKQPLGNTCANVESVRMS
jgi:hypothetical protein